jgi:hypothetical protein
LFEKLGRECSIRVVLDDDILGEGDVESLLEHLHAYVAVVAMETLVGLFVEMNLGEESTGHTEPEAVDEGNLIACSCQIVEGFITVSLLVVLHHMASLVAGSPPAGGTGGYHMVADDSQKAEALILEGVVDGFSPAGRAEGDVVVHETEDVPLGTGNTEVVGFEDGERLVGVVNEYPFMISADGLLDILV